MSNLKIKECRINRSSVTRGSTESRLCYHMGNLNALVLVVGSLVAMIGVGILAIWLLKLADRLQKRHPAWRASGSLDTIALWTLVVAVSAILYAIFLG